MCVGDYALCTMDSHGYMSDPLWPWVLWTLWQEYVLKAFIVSAYSCHTVCIVTAVWPSRSMSPSDIGFPMYAICINVLNALRGSGSSLNKHVGTRHIHRHETLPMHHSTPNMKLCRIFTMKMGHPPLPYSHGESLVRIVLCVLWRTWGKALPDFHHENKAKCRWIFVMEIW